MSGEQTSTLSEASAWWSVRLTTEGKAGTLGTCGGAPTGRVKWNTWRAAAYTTSIPFSSYDDGYACMKIPVLLHTHTGALLALAEARTPDCGDFSRTDLVYKRSTDGGATWGKLQLLAQPNTTTAGTVTNPPAPARARARSRSRPRPRPLRPAQLSPSPSHDAVRFHPTRAPEVLGPSRARSLSLRFFPNTHRAVRRAPHGGQRGPGSAGDGVGPPSGAHPRPAHAQHV